MATITLRTRYRQIAQYTLNNDQVIKIGRLPENDIIIDNPAVSSRHARIRPDGMGFIIEDAGSRNGTFIDGNPIKNRRLADGDIIVIGKHELLFTDQQASAVSPIPPNPMIAELNSSSGGLTCFLDTQQQKETLDQYNRLGHKTSLLVVKHKDKMLYKYILKYQNTGIGRNPNNRIVIDNPAVSAEHAIISRDNEGFSVTDLNSTNGTFVNKKQIPSACRLHDGDTITIGRHDIVFEEMGTYTYDEVAQPLANPNASLDASSETVFVKTQPADMKIKPGLSFLKGGKGYIPIVETPFRIGKNKSSHITAKGWLVGDTAARIESKADGYYLFYGQGIAKPAVNGQYIKKSIKLNNSDLIKIGSVKLQFHS